MADEIVAAGWGPDDPCPECVEALKRPPTPHYLSPIDVIGIHWHQVVVQLSRRFGSRWKRGDPQWGRVERMAFSHVMRTVKVKGELTAERLDIAFRAVGAWCHERLVPATRRMEEQFKLARDEDWWRAHGREFEPAFTDSLLSHDQRFGDLEYDLRALALARGMHEENSLTPERRVQSTVDDLIAHVEFLGDYPLWKFNPDGDVRLDPKKVKTALDGKVGRMKTRPEQEADGGQEAEEVFDVLDALTANEDIERVRQIVDERLARAKPGSARHVVLRSFFELHREEVTLLTLAERSSLSDSSLSAALVAERAAIAASIRAA